MGPMTTITFLGAGSVVFTRDLLADLFGFADLGPLTIRLHDIDADRLATADGIARGTATGRDSAARGHRAPRRRKALDGADFVINLIQVGGHASTEVDFDVPARHGLRQTIGDTLGIGGIFRALRTFPVLEGIAADMLDVCPDAWLLNYTNPMAMNVTYLHAVAPSLRARRAVPLGVLDRARPVRARRRAVRRGHVPAARASTIRRGCCAGSTRARPLSAPRRTHRRRPRAAPPGPRRHVPPPRLLPDRDERALRRVRPLVHALRRRD